MPRAAQEKHRTNSQPTLYLAMELSKGTWKLAYSAGGQKVRLVTVPAGSVDAVVRATWLSRRKLAIPDEARILSCYEAGRDGFWIHRALVQRGFENIVIDPSSIEVDRRARRAKTDRLDARKMVLQLVRHDELGDRMRVVHVPTAQDEDARRPSRELERLKKELTAHRTRIASLLVLHGKFDVHVGKGFSSALDDLRTCDGEPLPPQLKAEVLREYARLEMVLSQIRALEDQRAKLLASGTSTGAKAAAAMMLLKGIGPVGATILANEFFAWRDFKNRRQVGAAAGMAGTPYDSGGLRREQGISKAGNRRVRWVATELAWDWLRYQPESALTRWYQRRFAIGNKSGRRVGIVAVARRLLVELWRYLTYGIIPEGALMKGET